MLDHSVVQSALEPFFKEELITDVLHVVKSGKEATVYCCEAHVDTGAELLAAKVYRSRNDRTFKNDAIYQEGRAALLDRRTRKAVEQKSRFGRETQFSTWLGREFDTLRLLHAAGADVPKPYAHSSGAILMEYVGDHEGPAPALKKVRLDPDEAQPLFDRLIQNIGIWLLCGRVHADLSAFNILYWEGSLKVIDFPQAVDPSQNRNAYMLLQRDLENVCSHWSRYGLAADPRLMARDLWRKHPPR